MRQRKAARRRASRKKTAESRREYNRLTAEVRRAVSEAKLTKWTETCAKLDLADSRKTWKLLNCLERAEIARSVSAKSQTGPPMADTTRAHKLNVHFTNVGKSGRKTSVSKALEKVLRTEERTISEKENSFTVPFSRKELDFDLRQCKARKAPGADGIPNEILMHLGETGRRKLLELINRTWSDGVLPKL